MIEKPTTEISSMPFKYDHKRMLLNHLCSDLREETDRHDEEFKKFIQEFLTSCIDKDILEISKRPFANSGNYFSITGYKIGCPEKIELAPNLYDYTSFCGTLDFKIPRIYLNNFEEFIIKNSNKDQLEIIKEGVMKHTEMGLKIKYYGWDSEIIKRSRYVDSSFPKIKTLGQLYNACPEYYKIVYEHCIKINLGSDSDYLLDDLIKLLNS